MNCKRFAAWLDDGRPAALAAGAQAHAAGCAHCRAVLAAALELEHAFAAAPAIVAPATLADGVMRRVAESRRSRSHEELAPALPWWVRASADPATLAACTLAALVLWKGAALAQFAVALAAGPFAPFERGVTSATPALASAGVWARPEIAMGLALALLPGLAWLSWRLYHWAERLSAPRPTRGARRAR